MRKISLVLALVLASVTYAAQQPVNVGTVGNDHTGDPLRTAYTKLNANDAELYAKFPVSVANGGTGATTLTGVLKGNGTSAITAAAVSDLLGLFTGTCTVSVPLRGDGSCGTIPSSAVTGLAASATTDATNAANISSGTLPAGRLPALTGDCTTTIGTVATTCTKTGGVAFAASATTDATNASNISSGTLGSARLPNPSASTLGGIQSFASVSHQWINAISTLGVPSATQPAAGDISGLAASATTDTTNASNISSGTLAAARGGAGTIAGALKGNGAGVVSQAACADLSNASASCATDATNATNISSGTLAIARGGTGSATLAGASIPIFSGTITTGDCVQWLSATSIGDAGSPCGTGGGSAFSALTGGTNTAAAMVVGTGASLATSGTGTITATNTTGVNGAAVPTSAAVISSNASKQLTSATTTGSGNVVLATSPSLTTPSLGAATATTINGNTFTTGTYTLTGTAAKTLNFTNSLTLSGTDSTTMTFPGASDTVDTLGATQTFTAVKTFTNSDLALLGSSTGATTFTSANAGASNFTATVPANTGTLAETNLSQTWTGTQTFNGTLAGTAFASPPAIGGTTAAAGAFTTLSASGNLTTNVTGSTQCLHVNTSGVVSGTGSDCGTSGGSSAFNALTSGTNTSAAMVVGTGASLTTSGSGTITATNTTGVNGAAVPTSAAVLSSNGSSQLTSATTTGSGSVVLATSPALTTPNLGTPSAINLTNATALPLSALANLGTTTTVLHGNAAGNPSFSAVSLTADVSGILPGANGGTGNGFFVVSGPTTSSKTFTFPDASATVLTSNSAVTVAQGGTGLASLTAHDLIIGAGTSNPSLLAPSATSGVALISQGSTSDPVYGAINLAGGSSIVTGTLPVGNGGTGSTTLAGANIATFTGAITSGHCAQFSNTSGQVSDSGAACGGGGGSGTVNSATSGQLAYYASTGTAVSGLTVGNGLAINSGTISPTYSINAQTGTTYTVNCSTDAASLTTFSNASSVAVTLPQATGACGSGFSFDVQNKGAGTVTITPTTSTVNGASTLVIAQNRGCSISSDGTNYQVDACNAITPASNLAASGVGGVTGTLPVGNGGTGSATLAGASIAVFTGSPSTGQLATFASSSTIQGQNNLPIGVNAATSATSVTPNCTFDVVTVTASATGTFTVNSPGTCTPVNGQRLRIEVLSPAGGTVTYSFNAAFKASATLALPATSNAASKEDDFEFEFSSRLSGWKLMAYNQGF